MTHSVVSSKADDFMLIYGHLTIYWEKTTFYDPLQSTTVKAKRSNLVTIIRDMN